MYPEFLQRTLIRDVPTEEIRNWSGLAHRVIELTGPSPHFGEETRVVLWLHEDSAIGLLDMCDEIDGRFAALEAENAKLRKELEELSATIDADTLDFVHRLRDAAEKHEDVTIYGVEYMPYPVDADGVAIHAGDDMQSVSEPAIHGEVYRMELIDNDWWIYFRGVCTRPEKYRHYHKPTSQQ